MRKSGVALPQKPGAQCRIGCLTSFARGQVTLMAKLLAR
jgi:hypothetical protein